MAFLITGNIFSRDGLDASRRVPSSGTTSASADSFPDAPMLSEDVATGLPQTDSAGFVPDPIPALPDTLSVGIDTMSSAADSVAMVADSLRAARPSKIRRQKVDLDNQVVFSSADSMILIGRQTTYMYGDGKVDYGNLKLTASEIQLDLDSSIVYACGTPDSIGDLQGTPVFEEGGASYESKTMRYNFKSKRGFISDVITQQGEGYLTGGQTKKTAGEDYYIQNGKYTTCDQHDDPHFWLQLTRAKVRPKKNIVTGPAYMVLAGLPLPLAVPFGYFPFTDKYASGVIVPTFGDDYNRGFYLSDGGYYFAINDNIDMALTGEIYTKGSWGLSAQSTYNKRYKFNGRFNINYLKSIYGEKGDPDYSTATNFQVIWSHTQDSKANPNMNLSASVNFTTSGYTRNSVNSYYSSAFTENTKSSTVNLSYRFPQSKWSLSTSLNISQRTQNSTLAISFPNINVTMSQTNPFKRKKAVGDEKWYEKIRLSYSGQFQNSLTAPQNEFFHKSLIKDWRNGMKAACLSRPLSLFSSISTSRPRSRSTIVCTPRRCAGHGIRWRRRRWPTRRTASTTCGTSTPPFRSTPRFTVSSSRSRSWVTR